MKNVTIHRLKFADEHLCDVVYSGEKSFEIRKNDRGFKTGDLIVPISIGGAGNRLNHPIDNHVYAVMYVTDWPGVLQEGYCVFGIRPAIEEEIEYVRKDSQ